MSLILLNIFVKNIIQNFQYIRFEKHRLSIKLQRELGCINAVDKRTLDFDKLLKFLFICQWDHRTAEIVIG